MVRKFFRKANAWILAAAIGVTMIPAQMVSAAVPEGISAPAVFHQAEERTEYSAVAAMDIASITEKEYTVIKGNVPVLPKKVNLASADETESLAEIQWPEWDLNLDAGKHTITGTAGGQQLTVTVNVLPCDEKVEDVAATGSSDGSAEEKFAAIHDLKGYKGLFVAEYDIVPDDYKSTHDRAVIYLPERANDGSPLDAGNCWDTGARLQFKYSYNNITYFQTQIGDGQNVSSAKYYPTNDELDQILSSGGTTNALSFDEIHTYRVRVVMDTATDKTKGNYKVYITDPEGIEHEVTQPGGNGFRIYPKDGIVKKFAAVRGSYRLQNHKISWISGYATKKIETYLKASNAAEYVKESEDIVTKELPGVMRGQADSELVKGDQTYSLDTEKSGWYNGEEKVSSVTVNEGETAVYRAYYNHVEIIDEKEEAKLAMEQAVAGAEEKMTGMKETDYTPVSWKACKDALEACKRLDPQTAGKADYDAKKEALNSAMEGLTKRADKEGLQQAIAAAKAKKKADYETAGYKAMQKKLDAANKILEDLNVAQAEVDQAKKALLDSINKLVKKVKVKSIQPAAKLYKIAAGKNLDLKTVFTVLPKNADNKKLTYSIDKKYGKYASVKSGVVILDKKGAGKTVVLKATAADGSGAKSSIKIKIMKNAVTKITVKDKSLTVKAGEKVTIKPTVKVNGKDANKTLAYTSSNEKLAVVKNGLVTTKKGKTGKVTITIKSTDGTGKSAKVKITIKK